jgi:hypothetical protein
VRVIGGIGDDTSFSIMGPQTAPMQWGRRSIAIAAIGLSGVFTDITAPGHCLDHPLDWADNPQF